MSSKTYLSTVSYVFLCSVLLTALACRPTPGPDKSIAGAVLGAGWGAGAGAIIGNQTGALGPGAAIGAGFGALSGLVTGIGLDSAESTELAMQRELDALQVQVAANQRAMLSLQGKLDDRQRKLSQTSTSATLFFDSNQASLRTGAVKQLQRVANLLKQNPFVGEVAVHGHSDDTGNTQRNYRLSEARARTVAAFLGQSGVSLDQVRILSHGAEQPLATNQTESGRQLNRRAEIVLLR